MAEVHSFTFNDFQENTYIIYDESGECVIIDPGCSTKREEDELVQFIENNSLTPVRLLNTHCHIDHILGNKFVADKYNLPLEIHKGELIMLQNGTTVAKMYGIPYMPSPMPKGFLKEGEMISFGKTIMEILFTPGHSPASICFYQRSEKWIIAGDVLFFESIGRTDLPGGDHATLINSIAKNLMVLDDDIVIYPGHGPSTTIGHEREFNPFL